MVKFWRAVFTWAIGYVLLFLSALAVMFALTGCTPPPGIRPAGVRVGLASEPEPFPQSDELKRRHVNVGSGQARVEGRDHDRQLIGGGDRYIVAALLCIPAFILACHIAALYHARRMFAEPTPTPPRRRAKTPDQSQARASHE